jgi:hypothetical protein
MAKGKGAKGARKGGARKSTRRQVVPDRLPPATQVEDIAVNPDHGVDRIPVLERTANVPYVTPEQLKEKATGPEAKALAKANAQQEKAARDAAVAEQKQREALAAADEKRREQEYKDREKRAVTVRALRKGFYPADGRIRNPGEIFEYVPARILNVKTKKYEYEKQLPSWLQDVDGKLESREPGEPTPAFAAANPELTEAARSFNATNSSVI